MGALTKEQQDKFWADGVLVVEDAVSAADLVELRMVFEGWLDESRSHSKDYGETLDGRPRFDLQPGHTSCLLYTSPSPRDYAASRMPSSA